LVPTNVSCNLKKNENRFQKKCFEFFNTSFSFQIATFELNSLIQRIRTIKNSTKLQHS